MALFFASGFAALVYQVLWVRQLGLLFGSTAQAAAVVIAVFFAGIASGGWFWGRRAARLSSSLRWFGLVEIAVALTALGHFLLIDAYHALYPVLYAVVGHVAALDALVKAGLAAVVLLPPAFLMGGTLPLMGQHVVRHRLQLGSTGSMLYAVNTAGSAMGALAAGFVLPLSLGFDGAYLLAVGLDLTVGLTAVLLARGLVTPAAAVAPTAAVRPSPPAISSPAPDPAPGVVLPVRSAWLIAFASGFTALGVEVAWTRLFAQVLQNSAYTYALVLTTFLLALALGAGLASLLSRLWGGSPVGVLVALLLVAGVAVAASPWLFYEVTGGLGYLGGDRGWGGYVLTVAGVAGVVMLPAGTALGAVLPYLLRLLQEQRRSAGEVIGRLIASNTLGAIVGSLAAGFVLLPVAGAWQALLLLAAVYPALAAGLALTGPARSHVTAAGSVAMAGVALALASVGVPPPVSVDEADGERVVEVREGPAATVAVVSTADGERAIRVNNAYTLGGTRGMASEQNQTVIPMLTHADPASVFYLGMGTGITAGASLSFPVERVVVCEILPEVVDLAERHFALWTGELFADERVEIHADDGRSCLSRSQERYDLIISDLFTPWKAGTGSLYTLEHYQTARQRLNPGGLYVQWMPLYQVSDRELGIVARTMAEAFDQVVMWRGDQHSARSIVALVGQPDAAPLDPAALASQGRALLAEDGVDDAFYEAVGLRLYAGNVTQSRLYADRPLNTDANPLVEHLAPRTHRLVRSGQGEFLVGEARNALYVALVERVAPEDDLYLARLDARQRGYVRAGHSYAQYRLLSHQHRRGEAKSHLQEFLERSPESASNAEDVSPAVRLLE